MPISSRAKEVTGRATYSLTLSFVPSFDQGSRWAIIDDGDLAELNVEVFGRDGLEGFEATTKIDGCSSAKIHEACEEVLKDVGNWEGEIGWDGIVVDGSYESQTLGDLRFSFWSPERGDLRDVLVEAVFEAAATVNAGDDWNDYFEQLRSYFDIGVQVRLSEGSPAVLRISSVVSSDREDELRSICAQAAQCPELVIDMENFEKRMGTLLLPVFRPLVARTAPTTWRASKSALKYLTWMGVPGEKIEQIPETMGDNA